MDWKSIVGTVAPTIATALGGPLAGIAVSAIGQCFGLGGEATEEQVSQAIKKATPDQLFALKKADQEFQIAMRQLDVDLERITESSKDSAREREASTGDTLTPRILASLHTFFFFACLAFAGFMAYLSITDRLESEIPSWIIGILGTIFGAAISNSKQVLEYYFGSSSGSQAKDHLLFNSTPVSSGK